MKAKGGTLITLPVILPVPSPAPTQSRISAESAIEADLYDIAAWDARLTEASKEGNPEPVFERAVKQFPTTARIWMAYAEWCEAQDVDQALSVYRRCLDQILSLDLWTSFLNFCKRHQPLEEVFRAYQRASDLLGTDWRAGLLWAEYMALLKHAYNVKQRSENPDAEVSGKLLSEDPSPIEGARRMKPLLRKKFEKVDLGDEEFLRVTETLKIGVNTVRTAFQRAITSAHSALDKLWANYEQFEKSLGNTQLAQKFIAEYMPKYIRGKTTFKELQTFCNGVDHFAVSVPLTAQNAKAQSKMAEKWRRVLEYERTNPLRLERQCLQERVSLLYQQATACLAYHAEIWYDFHAWLDLCGQGEKATACLRQAVERFLPQDLTLRLIIAQRLEAEPSLEAVDDAYRALLDDMPKPCPLAIINFLAFVRRQRGGAEFREAFLEVTESSPHCTWEVYVFAALTEFHVYGSSEAAAGVFRLGLERYGEHEPSLLAAYLNWLIGANDMNSTRAELSRGVLDRLRAGVRDRMANRTDPVVRDSLAFLWQKWARLECYFGDAGASRRVATFRDTEYQNLQRDQDVEEEAIAETPLSLGLSTSITEVEEGFRFLHLVPQTARVGKSLETPVREVRDQSDVTERLAGAPALSAHIVRPDVSKMLAFRPPLDVIGRKADKKGAEDDSLTMIPKCLQDLLAVLPSRPLKGAKPDVDYLLTVLQTLTIPPIPVKDLEHFRYDSLRMSKDDDNEFRKRPLKEADGFFSFKHSAYRDLIQDKRRKVQSEQQKQQQKPDNVGT